MQNISLVFAIDLLVHSNGLWARAEELCIVDTEDACERVKERGCKNKNFLYLKKQEVATSLYCRPRQN